MKGFQIAIGALLVIAGTGPLAMIAWRRGDEAGCREVDMCRAWMSAPGWVMYASIAAIVVGIIVILVDFPSKKKD